MKLLRFLVWVLRHLLSSCYVTIVILGVALAIVTALWGLGFIVRQWLGTSNFPAGLLGREAPDPAIGLLCLMLSGILVVGLVAGYRGVRRLLRVWKEI